LTLIQAYTGSAGYLADYTEGPHQLFVAVECLVGDYSVNALLDTGSQWCILPALIAAEVANLTESSGPAERMGTRFGTIIGRLVRVPLAFVAEEGETLDVDATWFVSEDWPGPAVIGWKGCLERVRFALDPTREEFYFGEP
jgi:hypothetical protein